MFKVNCEGGRGLFEREMIVKSKITNLKYVKRGNGNRNYNASEKRLEVYIYGTIKSVFKKGDIVEILKTTTGYIIKRQGIDSNRMGRKIGLSSNVILEKGDHISEEPEFEVSYDSDSITLERIS